MSWTNKGTITIGPIMNWMNKGTITIESLEIVNELDEQGIRMARGNK